MAHPQPAEGKIAQPRLELLTDVIWLIFSVWYLLSALSYPKQSNLVPVVFGVAALVVSVVQFSGNFIPLPFFRRMTKGEPRERHAAGDPPPAVQNRRQFAAILWAFGLFLGIYLLGFKVAVPVFMFVYFAVLDWRKYKWLALASAVAMGLLVMLVSHFSVPLPSGVLLQALGF